MDPFVKLAEGACPLVPTDIFTAFATLVLSSIDISNPTNASQLVTVKLNSIVLFSVAMPALGGINWRGPQVIYTDQTINIVAASALCEYIITGEGVPA